MKQPLMISTQQSEGSVWRLRKGQSLRLDIGPGTRRLRVREGRLWLTGEGASDAPPEDVWVSAGQDVVLASGTRIVAEGWPQASFELIVPPQACAVTARRGGAWWPLRGQ
jgi:hypothetical protein